MKRLLPLAMFAVNGLFANQISENLAYSGPEFNSPVEEQIEVQKRLGAKRTFLYKPFFHP